MRSGTKEEHTRPALPTWYLAIYPATQSKIYMMALALCHHLGVSWRSIARLVKHKHMEAMCRRESARALGREVRIDYAHAGGEPPGGWPGRTSEHELRFVGVVQMYKGRPIRARFGRVANFSLAALRTRAAHALAPGCHIVSDGLLGFEVLRRLGHIHQPAVAPRGKLGTER